MYIYIYTHTYIHEHSQLSKRAINDDTLIFIMTVFFSSIKKLKFQFRSQNVPVRSLFSTFGINIVFFMLKKRQSL